MLDEKDISPEDATILDILKQRYGVWALRAYCSTGERLASRRRAALLGDVKALPEAVMRTLERRLSP